MNSARVDYHLIKDEILQAIVEYENQHPEATKNEDAIKAINEMDLGEKE